MKLVSRCQSMVEKTELKWLVLDGYEDEPAAFGVPPYIGFHVRYVCGVFEKLKIDYDFITVDEYRMKLLSGENADEYLSNYSGFVCIAGAVVPGKYLRGTPISLKELQNVVKNLPNQIPTLLGGWAVRAWRQQGWNPLRKNMFIALQDTDASLFHYLQCEEWKHKRRTSEQWDDYALLGAKSKAVKQHPDSLTFNANSPLTYEVEVYQGCVRYKQGCKFCIEPKKGVPIFRSPEKIIQEVRLALDSGVQNVRLGGMTDTYTYMAEGVTELEYPIPNPEPIAKLLHGLREDERLKILHTDNGNPSIIAENLEPSEEITKTLVETLSDGAVLSFGLESADPEVHKINWLNCSSDQLKTAVDLINKYGRERGERGLPKLLPGLNFIAGLNGETIQSYDMNLKLLRDLRSKGSWLRRINVRQVEGEGFQEIPEDKFKDFKIAVRDEIDAPLLEELFPVGQILRDVHWESHDNRTRLPSNLDRSHQEEAIRGKPGVTFGRQIGAYPILIGANYKIPLESRSDVLVTSHGKRSITAIEIGMSLDEVSQSQLSALPGIGDKTAWNIISKRAKSKRKNPNQKAFESVSEAFESINSQTPELAEIVFVA